MNKNLRGLRLAAAPAAIAAALLVATAAPASASVHDGYLEQYEMGLYYLVDRGGCVFDYNNDDDTFTDNKFYGPAGCHGRTDWVNDNTESYWNRDVFGWNVYTDWNYGGIKGSIPIGHIGNASSNFKNKISSSRFYVQ
ncbi:hypothetical protein ACGFYQ_23025 [Streptomyces sp. NPDC048258]|uniref:hypothetical protein n=1 Tax=Streptomyces sp. NPDC048258 TaxID=3365527 RepID=UPI00371A3A73